MWSFLEKYDSDHPQYYVHLVDISNPKGDPSSRQKMSDPEVRI